MDVPDRLPMPRSAEEFLHLVASLPPPTSVAMLRRYTELFDPIQNAPPLPEVGRVEPDVSLITAPSHGELGEDHGQRLRGMLAVPAEKHGGPARGGWPVMLFLHGGGWVTSSPWAYRKLIMRLAEQGFVVAAPDYRLAPEHEYPACMIDAAAGLRWLLSRAEELGGDASRLALVGDSAGAQMAALLCPVAASMQRAAARRTAGVASMGSLKLACGLIYGVLDVRWLDAPTEDLEPGAASFVRNVRMMRDTMLPPSREQYGAALWDANPINFVAQMPPTVLLCGTMDPFIEHHDRFAEALRREDIPHERLDVPGMGHGFVQCELMPAARPSIEWLCTRLRHRLA